MLFETSASTYTVLLQPDSDAPVVGSFSGVNFALTQATVSSRGCSACLVTAERCDDHRFFLFVLMRASLGGNASVLTQSLGHDIAG